ncbi:MAG: hypothetical protein V1784_11305 [bacterium]
MRKKNSKAPFGAIVFWRPRDMWYSLSEKQRAEYRKKQHAILERWTKSGVKWLGTYDCHFSSGWSMMAALEYPDLDTLQDFVRELNGIGRNRYFLTESHIGLRVAP